MGKLVFLFSKLDRGGLFSKPTNAADSSGHTLKLVTGILKGKRLSDWRGVVSRFL